jgi:hypothetical protein
MCDFTLRRSFATQCRNAVAVMLRDATKRCNFFNAILQCDFAM